jgi:hypothetical protein
MFTRLKATTFLTTSDSVATDDLVIMANSAFDPFQSEGSLQPAGFDQWAGFYALYRVWGAKITVSSVPVGSAGTDSIGMVAVVVDNTLTAITSANNAMSAPFVRWRLMGSFDEQASSYFSSLDKKLRIGMSTQKILGISSTAMEGNPNLQCATTTNPTTTWFFHIVNATFTGSGESRFTHIVEIQQDVEFFDRLPLADAEGQRQKVRKAFAERKVLNKPRGDDLKIKSAKSVPVNTKSTGSRWSDEDDDAEIDYEKFLAWKRADKGDEKTSSVQKVTSSAKAT